MSPFRLSRAASRLNRFVSKSRGRRLSRLAALLLAGSLASIAPVAAQSPLFWDPAQSGGLGSGGNGTWNTTDPLFSNGATAGFIWNNANNATAIFSGASGNVAINQLISAGNVSFASSYTLTLSASGILNSVNGISTGGATVNQSGGTVSIGAGGQLSLGSGGVYGLAGGGTLQVGGTGGITGPGSLALGAGTIQVTNSALTTSVNSTLTAGAYSILNTNGFGATWSGNIAGSQGGFIKAGAGDLAWSGTNNIGSIKLIGGSITQASGALTAGELGVGTDGGTGTYNFSGGTMTFPAGTPPTIVGGTAASLRIGDFGGTGVFNQTGGTVNVNGSLNVGNQGGNGTYNLSAGILNLDGAGSLYSIGRTTSSVGTASSGTFNLSGTGTINVNAGQFFIGDRDDTGPQGTGLMTQTGGSFNFAPGAQLFLGGYGSSTYNLNGGTLQIGGSSLQGALGAGTYAFNLGGGTILVSGSALNTSVNASLTAGTVSFLNTNGLGATWTGNITGLSAGLVKSGAGDLALSGTDSIGTFAIVAGSVSQASGSLASRELLVGTGAGNTGTYNFSGGTINLPAGAPPFGGSAPSLRVGDFGGTGTFNQTGGTVTAAGSLNIGNEGGTGTYNLSAGTLNLSDADGLTSLGRTTGAGVSSGTLNISGTGVLNATIDSFILGNREIGGGVNGTGTITQTGGVFSIQGNTRLYLGGYGASTYNLNGGRLEVGGNGLQGLFTGQGANVTGSYTFSLGGGTILVTGSALTTSVNASLVASPTSPAIYSVINTNGLGATWSGNITGGQGGLIKTGAGDLALSGTSAIGSFLVTGGSVTQSAGTINSNEIAVGTGAGNTASYVMNGGTINMLPGQVAPIVSANPLAQSSLRVGDFNGTGTFTQNAGTVNVSGSLNVGNQGGTGTYNLVGGTLNLADGLYNLGRKANDTTASPSTGTLNISGGLLDVQNGNFILGSRDPGTLASTSNGTVNQTGGTFRVSGTSVLNLAGFGNGTYNLNGGALEVGGNGLLTNYNGAPGTYAFNMGGGTLRVIGSALNSGVNTTLTGGNSTIDTNGLGATWSGVIGGTGSLTKAGAGVLSLTAANTFTGTTTVSGGTLRAAGAGGAALGGTSAVVINEGSTLLLGGSQQINNAASMTLAGGTFATGAFDQNLGPLTVSGSGSVIDMASGGMLAFANSSGVTWTGTLSIYNWAGTIVDHQLGGDVYTNPTSAQQLFFGTDMSGLTPTQLASIRFFSDAGTTFVGYGEYYSVGAGGLPGQVIAAVPEPSTYLAAALALGALGWHQRRRIRAWLSNSATAQPVA